VATKKPEGFCENSRQDVAIIGSRRGSMIKVEIVQYHWACLLEGKPVPFIPMEDGTQVLASEVPGFLGVDLSVDNDKEEKETIESWKERIERFDLHVAKISSQDDEDEDDDDDDADDDEDDADDDEDVPVRVRPRRR
jgi:hypothetical protein